MADNLRVLRDFVTEHEDVALVFPVHPNPAVVGPAADILAGHPRIHLIAPLRYDEFVVLLSHAWLIVSDSGGVQEEAPTLRKRLLVLRENTERPEVIESGVARLVGGRPERLALMLDESYRDRGWSRRPEDIRNPFGDGDSLSVTCLLRQSLQDAVCRDLEVLECKRGRRKTYRRVR